MEAARDLSLRRLEDLPDLSTGNPRQDLRLLETALTSCGRTAIYADLTRRDLGIPIARAIVPGLEHAADFDRHSRISRRL